MRSPVSRINNTNEQSNLLAQLGGLEQLQYNLTTVVTITGKLETQSDSVSIDKVLVRNGLGVGLAKCQGRLRVFLFIFCVLLLP